MKIKISFFLFTVLLIHLAKAQSADVTSGCLPLTVKFMAPPSSTNWYWDFKDGVTSPEQNPKNTFSKAGSYLVEFSEYYGGPIKYSVTIHVYDKPIVDLTPSPFRNGCTPFFVNFAAIVTNKASGITINNYTWDYDDGSPSNSTILPLTSHTYNSPGGTKNVSVKLETNMLSCNITTIFPAIITSSDSPVTHFLVSEDSACVPPLTVSFVNNSFSYSNVPLTYEWALSDGSKISGTHIPNQTYTASGTFTTTLTAIDTNGCQSSYSKSIFIGKPFSSFVIPDTLCFNPDYPNWDSISIDSFYNWNSYKMKNYSTQGIYKWTFDNSVILHPKDSLNTKQPRIIYTSAGNHTVTLRTSSEGCYDDTSITIYVQTPHATFVTIPTYSCDEPKQFTFSAKSPNAITSWLWQFPILDDGSGKIYYKGPVWTDNTGNIQYIPSHNKPNELFDAAPLLTNVFSIPDSLYSPRFRSIFTSQLFVLSTAGCFSPRFTFKDTIHLPFARFMPDVAEGCAPLTVIFSDSSHSHEPITTWVWNYGDGTAKETLFSRNNHTHTFTTPGTYSVSLIIVNSGGCTDTSFTVEINVGQQKTIDFTTNKTTVCQGETISFLNTTADKTGFTGWNYSSDGEHISHCFQDDYPVAVFDDSVGAQTITLTGENTGCYSTASKTNYIHVKGPIAKFTWTIDCAAPNAVTFTNKSLDATSISWNFGDGSSPSSTTGTFTHTYSRTGDYKVILTAINGTTGCANSYDTSIVHIRNIKAKFVSDSLFCRGVDYTFDARSSVDVFQDCYQGYTWIFGDPIKRPVTYDNPINSTINFNKSTQPQTVGLIVRDINGCKDTSKMKTIKVYGIDAKYTISDYSICFPDTLTFTDKSIHDTTIVSWKWMFGNKDSSFLSSPTAQPFSKQKTKAKNIDTLYNYLMVKDALGCKSEMHDTIFTYTPTTSISVSPGNFKICSGNQVSYSATDFTSQGSSLLFKWNFGDGSNAFGSSVQHAFANAGTYTVSLHYSENASGCGADSIRIFNVQDYPTAGFSTNVDTLVALCSPQQINFKDTSKIKTINALPFTVTQWDFGTGTFSSGDNEIATHTFKRGTFLVRMKTSTNNKCADTASYKFKIIGPDGKFTINDSMLCKGDSVIFSLVTKDTIDVAKYRWDFGDGEDTTNVNPVTHTYDFLPPSGSTIAKLIIYGKDGECPRSKETNIYIHFVKADFILNNGHDTAVCIGQSDTLVNRSSYPFANVFKWDFGDGTPIDSSVTFSPFYHKYSAVGSYTIQLIASSSDFGCIDTTAKNVMVNPLPIITALGDTICRDNRAYLNVTKDATWAYLWTPQNELNNATVYNPNLIGSGSETFIVTVTDTNNCVSKAIAPLYVVQPLTDIYFDTSIVIGDIIKLPITKQNDIVQFSWVSEVGLSCTDCAHPQIQPMEDIIYNVTMADSCMQKHGVFVIHVKPEMFLELPTTFTPNGDGANDIIYVKGWGIKDLLSFEIYNRWGELVFTTSDLAEGWNGYYKGMLQNNDTYVWKVKALTWRNTTLGKEGHFNLMR